jgi:sulfide:quinone oxidoreductase
VVTLPRLRPNRIEGLPADGEGFIPVDEHAGVRGVEAVYAVGDATSFPIKQGGLATQHADAAAAAIAFAAGAAVSPEPFTDVMRGLLLTGVTSAYLRVEVRAPERSSTLGWDSRWWAPTKVAGRFLAPYLAGEWARSGPDGEGAVDVPSPTEPTENRALALRFAEADLSLGDHGSALHWLRTVEWLDGMRTPEVTALRERCEGDRPIRRVGERVPDHARG